MASATFSTRPLGYLAALPPVLDVAPGLFQARQLERGTAQESDALRFTLPAPLRHRGTWRRRLVSEIKNQVRVRLQHLYFAEMTGLSKIWEAADAMRAGSRWTEPTPHRGKRIEQIIEETWRAKEVAPAAATPRVGGPLGFWVVALGSLRPVLVALADRLKDLSLEDIVAPHFLSGLLDARQRLEFLRFHLERHHAQITRTMAHPGFPDA